MNKVIYTKFRRGIKCSFYNDNKTVEKVSENDTQRFFANIIVLLFIKVFGLQLFKSELFVDFQPFLKVKLEFLN